MSLPRPQLAPRFQRQDDQFCRAISILQSAVREQAFPGAVLAVTVGTDLVCWRAVGRFTYEEDSPSVAPTTIFDLASVSKAVATTTMAMILFERGVLDLDSRVVDFFPEFASDDPRREQINLRMLLAHSSGLPAWREFWRGSYTRESVIQAALATPLEAAPMTRAEYSDIGFIILGEILAKLASERLDSFCEREIFQPLGMSTARYCPPPEWKTQIPPTVNDTWLRQRVVQGEVNDENCSVMGGVSGHAGLFGSAFDVAMFASALLSGGKTIVRPETVRQFTTRESHPAGTSRTLGWDTPSSPSQSGRYFGPFSFGHLGYTGTSLWCDPDRMLSVTLLTNRTWPDRDNQQIKSVRPAVHDAIIQALEE